MMAVTPSGLIAAQAHAARPTEALLQYDTPVVYERRTFAMPRRSYKGEKRRKQLEKQRKQEAKRQRRQNKDSGEEQGEDTSYLEYLQPGGPMDERYLADEDEEGGEQEPDDTGAAPKPDSE